MPHPLVIADPSVPWVREALDGLPLRLELHPSSTLVAQPEILGPADALVVPSTCPVDARLLSQARRLKAIASPVVGREHVHQAAVRRLAERLGHPVPVFFAPGSTAGGVGDYAAAAIALAFPLPWPGRPPRVGIWGFGRCGQALAARLDRLGIPWIAYDPPREARSHHRFRSVTREDLSRCDAVSIHVPATRSPAPWPTLGMVTEQVLERLRAGGVRLVINTSRGEVLAPEVITPGQHHGPALVLDVFHQEPSPPPEEVLAAFLATPHVAGLVQEGRWRAMIQVRRGLLRRLGLPAPALPPEPPGGFPGHPPLEVPPDVPPEQVLRMLPLALPLEPWSRDFRQAYGKAPPSRRALVFREHRARGQRREIRWSLPREARPATD